MVNVIIDTYNQEDMGDLLVKPEKGSVAFGSGKECWGFTVTKFARIYAARFGTSYDKLMGKLWGDNFYDKTSKKWKTEGEDDQGKPIKRAFVTYIMDPIVTLCNSIMSGNKEQSTKMLTALNIQLS